MRQLYRFAAPAGTQPAGWVQWAATAGRASWLTFVENGEYGISAARAASNGFTALRAPIDTGTADVDVVMAYSAGTIYSGNVLTARGTAAHVGYEAAIYHTGSGGGNLTKLRTRYRYGTSTVQSIGDVVLPFALAIGVRYGVRMRITGAGNATRVQARAWVWDAGAAGYGEPAGWMLDNTVAATTLAFSASGVPGFGTDVDSSPVLAGYRHFWLLGVGTGGDTAPLSMHPPVAGFTVQPDGLAITCTSTATDDGGITLTEYDFGTGDGFSTASTHVYREAANYTITQRVTDADGMQATAAVNISVAPPASPPDVTYRLRIYEPDDVTVMADFGTDPAHAYPYLIPPENFRAQEIDLARGAARIGQVDVAVIDPPTIPGDQASGYVTGILATAGGYSAVIGRRFLLEELTGAAPVLYQEPGDWTVVMDGVCGDVALRATYAGYNFSLRDIRERERTTKAFVSAARRDAVSGALIDAPTVWPRGRLAGYGAVDGGWALSPPVTPALGTYANSIGPLGWPTFGFGFPTVDETKVPAGRVFTDRMRKALQPDPQTGLVTAVRLLFRLPGQTTYTEAPPLSPISYVYTSHPPLVNLRRGKYRPAQGDPVDVEYISALAFAWPLAYSPPFALGAQVEVVLAYVGAPTPDYPFRWEGPAGSLVAELYDGWHSRDWAAANAPPPPRIRYDAGAVAALTTPLRVTREKPVDDLREWMEPNVYAILGAAPALNAAGAVAPVRYRLPDADVPLLELNNSNCAPVPGWSHGSQDAVNVVEIKYVREYRLTEEADPLQRIAAGDGLAGRVIPVKDQDPDSVALLGEQLLSFTPETLRAIGGTDGQPISGDVTSEAAHQVAMERIRQALDRLVLGGQLFAVRAMRSDPAVEAAREGDWALEGTTWKPDYGTGQRGANRLAQIFRRKDLNPRWTELELLDAGPAHQPVGQPTLGALTAGDDGIVTVPVTALAAGSEAAIYYAVSPTLPPNGSALWTFASPRLDAPGTRDTPALPAGATVWVRGRGEAPGRRSSAHTNAVSITIPQTPRIISAQVYPGEDVLTWTVNAYVLGLRITATKNGLALPVLNVAAAGGQVALPYHAYDGDSIEITLEPWTGWTGSNVSGTAGPAFTLTWSGGEVPPAGFYGFTECKILPEFETPTHFALGFTTGPGVTVVRGAALLFQSGVPNSEDSRAAVENLLAPVVSPLMIPKATRSPQFALGMLQVGWTSAAGVEQWGQKFWQPVMPPPAYRPEFLSVAIEGQKVKPIAVNTASIRLTRLSPPAGGEYTVILDGSAPVFDLGAVMGATDVWDVEVRAYDDPAGEHDADTLSVAESRMVRGVSATTEVVITGMGATEPQVGSDEMSFSVATTNQPTYTLHMETSWALGSDLPTEWEAHTPTPALVAPNGVQQDVTIATGFPRSGSIPDGSQMPVVYHVRVKVKNAAGDVVDSGARQRSWYTILT